jgi:pimeloyl-ACP methyl ester carboxylesterase
MTARRWIALCLLLVGMALATVQFWIALLVFRPTPLARPDPLDWGLPRATAMHAAAPGGGAITGWWQPPRGPGDPVVLIAHGRSANVATRAPIMRRLVADGMGVLMVDYRGYGASSGRPSERHLGEDMEAAWRWLVARRIAPGRIVLIGQSLGNGPAAGLAARHPVGALILVSPFTSLPEALGERLPWLPVQAVPWTRNRFDVAASLARFRGPSLLVASDADGLVPAANARRLRTALPRAQWLDATPLRHDGLLQAIAEDGRLTAAIRALAARRENSATARP